MDVWSLGACFYWMIVGVPPFNIYKYDTDDDLAQAILSGEFELPEEIEMS